MTTTLFRALVLATALFWTGCAYLYPELVRLEATHFDDLVDQTQNLTFEFNKDLATTDMLNKWDTTRYIAFTPSIPGRFKWVGTRKLVFSPAQALQPGTRYKGTLQPALLKHGKSDWRLDEAAAEVTFATERLQLAQATAYWTAGNSGNPELRVRLSFNYPVVPAVLQQHLEVQVGGSVVSATVLSQETAPLQEVAVSGVPMRDAEAVAISLMVKSGMTYPGAQGPLLLPETRTLYAPLPSALAITQVYPQMEGSEGKLYVYTSQSLRTQNLADYVRIRPYGEYLADTLPLTNLEIQPIANGLVITGPFQPDINYQVTLLKGLPGVLGATLAQSHSQQVSFGMQAKVIDFVHQKGTYLGSKGQRNLAVRIANVGRIRLKIAKVYENNLMAFLNTYKRWQYHYDEASDSYHEFQYYDIERYGDVVEEQTWEADKLPQLNGARLLKLDFNDPRKAFDGIYIVEVSSEDEYWVRSSKIVTVSDIGLMARHGRNQLMVFAHSLNTAEPVADCPIHVVSTNNQTFLKGRTDANGVCVFSGLEHLSPSFTPAMVTARQDGDFSYLMFQKSKVETSRFEVGGKTTRDRLYDTYIYAERELYRPGETLHLNTLVRSFRWEPIAGMPVQVAINFPDGKRFRQFQAELSPQGALETTCPIPVHAPTGKYQVTVTAGQDQVIGTKAIYVEEFMPDRIRVQLDIPQPDLQLGQALVAEALAGNFFGYPAAHRNYEAEVQLSRQPFAPKGLDAYDFTIATEANYPALTDEGKTDAEGMVRLQFPLPQHYKHSGLLAGQLYLTVFDENGRPIHRMKPFRYFTQDVFMGIGKFDHFVSAQRELRLPIVAVDTKGQRKAGQRAVLQVVRAHWETVIERQSGQYRYVSKRHDQLVYERNVVTGADGTTQLAFMPPGSGDYEVRLYLPEAKTYVARSFYCYGWSGDQESGFEVNNDGQVDIAMEKETYALGETANLVFKTPFDGKLIVTLEQDSVLMHKVLETKDQAAYLPLKLEGQHMPSVFVSATLIRPMQPDGNPFTVAHGYRRIAVEDPARRLPMTLVAAETSRSRTRQSVVLQTAPGAEVTIAVVDEGILALRDTPTPDPLGYYYAPRALEVAGYDIYPQVLPELMKAQAGLRTQSSGGSDDTFMGKRQNPLANRRVKLVSFWSGILKADASGTVRYSFDIPQFNGSLRIMAVAWQGNRFGSVAKNLIVADPIVISAGIPRFFSPGDTVQMPVTLTNTTAQATDARVQVLVEGPLGVVGTTEQTLPLRAHSEGRLRFRLAANAAIGEAKITVKVQALNEGFWDETELTVRPPSTLQFQTGAGSLTEGKPTTLALPLADYLPQSRGGRLIVSRNPALPYMKDLTELVRYPHGCLEQTVSQAFPQLYFADLATHIPLGHSAGTPGYHVQQAIFKLQNMQTYGGGLTYWPGGDEESVSWWGSAYAAHFLIEAEKAGYAVNKGTLAKLLNYLQQQAGNRNMAYYTFLNGQRSRFVSRETVYSLFVLALSGRKPTGLLNYYRQRQETLTPDSRYLLAGAYALLGDQRSWQALVPPAYGNLLTAPETGGTYASPVRDRALALYVLLQADPQNPQVPGLARTLGQQMGQVRHLSTQERSFAFMALGRLAQRASQSQATATIVADGKPLGVFLGQDLVLDLAQAPAKLSLQAQGAGQVYYFWEMSGISASGSYVEEDSKLQVRRTYYTRKGDLISKPIFKQNELVVVKLSLQAERGDEVENIALTDLLPAGLEIENPRLSVGGAIPWLQNVSVPQHLDIRDDRIHFFTGLGKGEHHTYYYLARAVTVGKFRQGPASADAMYDGSYHSYHGGGWVEVLEEAAAD